MNTILRGKTLSVPDIDQIHEMAIISEPGFNLLDQGAAGLIDARSWGRGAAGHERRRPHQSRAGPAVSKFPVND